MYVLMRWQRVYADAQPLSGNGRDYIRMRIHWEVQEYSVPQPRPTLHLRSVVLTTCETETTLREYVKA